MYLFDRHLLTFFKGCCVPVPYSLAEEMSILYMPLFHVVELRSTLRAEKDWSTENIAHGRSIDAVV